MLKSRIGRKFDQNRFNIRPPETLYRFDEMVPFFLVGDEIFKRRPFAGMQLTDEMRKVFNYRLSRARRIIESTFRILISRWRIAQKPTE